MARGESVWSVWVAEGMMGGGREEWDPDESVGGRTPLLFEAPFLEVVPRTRQWSKCSNWVVDE